jgi:hypothetical protein
VFEKHAPISWTNDTHTAFDKMLALMATDVLSAYLDQNKRFDIYTDASDFN